ncbi:MAG: sel1 repeat family protein [Lachnospiraceae bacterium]|nr:sel1 repeat family protein [Lachnospiraceae bacterium]
MGDSKKTNFFCSMDVLKHIKAMDYDFNNYKDIAFTMDIIEAPYMMIYTPGKDVTLLGVYQRGEIYSHDDSGRLAGAFGYANATGDIDGSPDNKMIDESFFFMKACKNLNAFIQDKKLQKLYKGLDPELEGVLLTLDKDEVKAEVVSGKKRPDLLCDTLFGGLQMCRPYMDESMDQWLNELAGEDMSLEEKIQAAEDGDEFWIRELIQMYMYGDEDEELDADPSKVLYWMEKLAELGDSEAMYNAGILYAKGENGGRDMDKAYSWMKEAYENGDPDAEAILDDIKKASMDEIKAKSGDPQGQADFAKFLMTVKSDYNLRDCFVYARMASFAGNADGHYVVGLCYQHGRGCEQNYEKAADYYMKGAQMGDMNSQYNYGCLVLSGSIKGDKKEAVEWVEKAANQGYDLAQSSMSTFYENGKFVDQNLDKAIEWGEKAAEQGNKDIQYQVAKLYTYEGDDGKMINPKRAKYWLDKAAKQGHEMAYGMLNFGPMWEE